MIREVVAAATVAALLVVVVGERDRLVARHQAPALAERAQVGQPASAGELAEQLRSVAKLGHGGLVVAEPEVLAGLNCLAGGADHLEEPDRPDGDPPVDRADDRAEVGRAHVLGRVTRKPLTPMLTRSTR